MGWSSVGSYKLRVHILGMPTDESTKAVEAFSDLEFTLIRVSDFPSLRVVNASFFYHQGVK